MFSLTPQPTDWGRKIVNARSWEQLQLQEGAIAAVGQRRLPQDFTAALATRVFGQSRFQHFLLLPVNGIQQHLARAVAALLEWPDDDTTRLFVDDLAGLAGMVGHWGGHWDVTVILQNARTLMEWHRDAAGGDDPPHAKTRTLVPYLGQGTHWRDEEKLSVHQTRTGDIFVIGTGNQGVLHSTPCVAAYEPRLLTIIDPPEIGEAVKSRPVWRP